MRALNYPTPAALFSALKHWAEAHMWCLRNIAEATLYLNDISRDVIEEQVHGPQGWRLLFVRVSELHPLREHWSASLRTRSTA